MSPVLLTRLSAVLLILAATSSLAQTPQYLPLEPGLEWDYVTTEGGTSHQYIEGPIEVFGVPCTSVFFDDVAHHTQTYRSFWTVDDEGNMFLHGAQNFRYPFLALYDPPVPWLVAPLEPGQTWTWMTWIFHQWDHSGTSNQFRGTLSVKGIDDVTTPEGTFPCHMVGFLVDPETSTGEYDLLGRYIGAAKDGPHFEQLDWWADGMGYVRRAGNLWEGEYFELESWNGGTISPVMIPGLCELRPCAPNPFNPVTSISFVLPDEREVELSVYGVDGKRVATLVDQVMAEGTHRATWAGQDDSGQAVPSGVYFYQLSAGGYSRTRSMVLLK